MLSLKKYLLVFLIFLGAISLAAAPQTTSPPALVPYPDINTSQTAAGISLIAYKAAMETNVATSFKLGQDNAIAINKLTDQSAQIVALKAQLTADETRIVALETKLAALVTKTVTAGTALTTP
jgi:hypothetical protein